VLTGLRRLAWLLVVMTVATACVPPPPQASAVPATPTPSPRGALPAGWEEHELDGSGTYVGIPGDWIVLDAAAVADPARQAGIERDFAGAQALFGRLAAQGRSARIVLLAIDPASRGSGTFPPVVAVVAVEPALPRLLLGIGADFAVAALGSAFAIETEVEKGEMETSLGEGIRIGFDHRVVLSAAGGAGARVEHDGVLVTTGAASFLVSRLVDPVTAPPETPGLETFAATLRVEP
jgi:hypothetical protein